MKTYAFVLATAAAIAASGASTVYASSDAAAQPDVPTDARHDFGRSISYFTSVDSAALVPYSTDAHFVRSVGARGYACAPSGLDNRAMGQFHLPHGVQMNAFRVWGLDNNANAGSNVTAELERMCLPDFAAGFPFTHSLASTTSSGAPGDFTGVGIIGGERADNTSCTYRLIVTFANSAAGCGGMALHKARIEWRRVTPPAPAAATFSDVPTNHTFFEFVEALAAVNVTLGCTATEFCVDDPVTRGQMAAFLVRALSLQPSDIPDIANP